MHKHEEVQIRIRVPESGITPGQVRGMVGAAMVDYGRNRRGMGIAIGDQPGGHHGAIRDRDGMTVGGWCVKEGQT